MKNSRQWMLLCFVFGLSSCQSADDTVTENNTLEYHSFTSQEELAAWSERAKNGPFLNVDDAFIGSPGSYSRIKSYAALLSQHQEEIVITGTCVAINSNDPSSLVSSSDFGRIGTAVDAVFVDFVEGTNIHTDIVKSLLLEQAQAPCMDFSNKDLYPENSNVSDVVWSYSEWIHRFLLAYDYLGQDVFTVEEQEIMDNWFKSAASWFDFIITDRTMDPLYTSRVGLPEYYVINFDHWANTGIGEQRYKDSALFHPPSTWLNNRQFAIANFVTHVGVMYDNAVWKEIGAQLVREYISFHFDDDGYYAELVRSTTTYPSYGLAYGANTLVNVAEIAHVLNFDGYTNLFEYQSNVTIDPITGDITAGSVVKDLEWVMLSIRKHFMLSDAPAIYPLGSTLEDSTQIMHLCLNTLNDYSTQVVGRFYSGAAIINHYYNNPTIAEIYSSEYGNMCGVEANEQIRVGPHAIAPSYLFQYANIE